MRTAGGKTVVLGIDPGLANTGWGIVEREGARLHCVAYGCISTPPEMELSIDLQVQTFTILTQPFVHDRRRSLSDIERCGLADLR